MNFSEEEVERYARHLVLPEVGGPGQQKLKAASVLIVGAGGLGAPAAIYLAAAGVGHIAIADPDVVSLSNLQRQILYGSKDIGASKVRIAVARLNDLNPHPTLVPIEATVTAAMAVELISQYDIVLDGTDNFATRHIVNAGCVVSGTPLVSGAIGRWSGQVGVFAGRPCYRCLVPEAPTEGESCVSVGVIGALAGVVGSMMALEATKLIAGAGEPLIGRLLIYDSLAGETRTVRVGADPACPVCGA